MPKIIDGFQRIAESRIGLGSLGWVADRLAGIATKQGQEINPKLLNALRNL
jgi:hypothetical protein